ncbi:hypothetical protein V6N13_007810 [Hibiscus sabdariffa]|uniref:Uncharacterized protein n=1 Tax=Hibiscus sabdariffa TaxID=183260 RepID=A0ABR2EML2_9ROSI
MAASKPQTHTTTTATAKRKEDPLVKPHKRHDNIDTNTYYSVRREIKCIAVVTNNPSANGGGRAGGRKKWEGDGGWRARERG